MTIPSVPRLAARFVRHLRLAAFVSLACACSRAPQEPPPNVVLIISDDQAWGDYGFMGHPAIRTPRLDALAAQGAVFERGYVPSSLCRPSLATMITGLHPHQHKITGNDPPAGIGREAMLKHIQSVPTLPRLLAARGYLSLQTGKWWEGNCLCGGFTEGMTHGEPARGGRHGDDGLLIGRKTMQPIRDFIGQAQAARKPFFLWYAPMLPHQPHDPPERLVDHYRGSAPSPLVAKYWANCERFDETCGELLDMLDERKLAESTLVVFLADNGWIQDPSKSAFDPRSKRSPYEGGVRTPIVLRWPGQVPATRSQAPVSSVDLAPTVLRACGIKPIAAMPGIDLIRLARGGADRRDGVFGAIFGHEVADIDAPAKGLAYRWTVQGWTKLVWPVDPAKPAELYDLRADPGEKHNLAPSRPRDVLRLEGFLDAWWKPR